MASLKKPAICGYCESTDFVHKYDPERWECVGCERVIAQRPQRISGVCRKCGASEKDKPFKKGKNLCLECDNRYMVEWRKKNPGWNDSPEFKKRRFETVRRAIQKSPESFIKHLFLCLTRPSRKHKKRNNTELSPRRLATLNDVQITLEWLIETYRKQKGKCAITGVDMQHHYGIEAISIDRIDSLKGYTPDNVHLVCQWVNNAKNKHPIIEIKCALDHFLAVHGLSPSFRSSSLAPNIDGTSPVSQSEPGCLDASSIPSRNPCSEQMLGCPPTETKLDGDYMTEDEVIAFIMEKKGVTREQAILMMVERGFPEPDVFPEHTMN